VVREVPFDHWIIYGQDDGSRSSHYYLKSECRN
jgi:hypothetical protein